MEIWTRNRTRSTTVKAKGGMVVTLPILTAKTLRPCGLRPAAELLEMCLVNGAG